MLIALLIYLFITLFVCAVCSYTSYKIGASRMSNIMVILYSALWPLVCVMTLVYYICEMKNKK